MAQLLGIRIQNFKSLADVKIGRLSSAKRKDEIDLTSVSCFIGRNGCGKSSLLDVFAFIADCLREGVEAACDKEWRGGFDRLRTQGKTDPISFELYFRLSANDRPMKYEFGIDAPKGIPEVAHERLYLSSKQATIGRLGTFLDVTQGKGKIWLVAGDEVSKKGVERVDLRSLDRLAIASYGDLPDHPRIGAFRKYLESWYLSYFVPGDARRLPPSGAHRRLDRTGSNVSNVLQYLQRQHGDRVTELLAEIAAAIPGVTGISVKESLDKRLLLAFSERGYKDAFYQYAMSDGTLKYFAYMLLLHDPDPPAFVGIEEPENGLYHKLHGDLASKFVSLAERSNGQTQVLVTTHSPYFVDELEPDAVWFMSKQGDGLTRIARASEAPGIERRLAANMRLGVQWYSNHLDPES